MNPEATSVRQRQDLTRMNHDRDDDADLLREHQTHLDLENSSLDLNNRTPRLPGGTDISMPTEAIRAIVVIVGHPREVV